MTATLPTTKTPNRRPAPAGLTADTVTPETHVARVATRHPGTIRIFQRHGIDFCCGGKRPLSEACDEAGIAFSELRDQLLEAGPLAADETDWDAAPLGELVDHILERYHRRLDEDLPRLSEMAAKVLRAHGERHPEMVPEVHRVFAGLRAEMESHTAKEEQVLFPYVRRLEALEASGEGLGRSPFGTVRNPIDCMEDEHDGAARALARLREVTGGFQPPANACPTFRGLFHGLEELESDTHRHIHLENNVLFPRATELEARLLAD